MTDELDKPENQGRVARWEEIGVDAIRADLEHANGLRHVGRHADLAWRWVKSKEGDESKDNGILMLEPNLYGLGFRLKPLLKWFTK